MQKYELVYIIHPDLENTLDKVTDKINGFVKKRNGAIIKEDIWGKRKLAYAIKKNDFGIYVLLHFEMEQKSVQQFEKDLILSEEVIRHLIVILDEEAPVRKYDEKGVEEIELKEKKEKKPKKEELELEEIEEEKEVEEPKKTEKQEKERLKELDEKLDELLKKEE